MSKALILPGQGEFPVHDLSTLKERLLKEFLSDADLSHATKDTYRKALKVFFCWVEENLNSHFSSREVRLYRNSLMDSGLSPLSVSTYLTSLRSFFDFLVEKELVPYNPAARVKGAKRPRGHLRDSLVTHQVRRLLDVIDTSNPLGKRDFAMINLMVRCGLRSIEINRTNVGDLRAKEGEMVLYVQGKGRETKDEFVVVLKEAYGAITDYLAERGPVKDQDPLFCGTSNRSRGRLSTRSIRGRVAHYMNLAGIKTNRVTTHSLRHTAATLAIAGGASILAVQEMMRHSSINTTRIYIHEMSRVRGGAEHFIQI